VGSCSPQEVGAYMKKVRLSGELKPARHSVSMSGGLLLRGASAMLDTLAPKQCDRNPGLLLKRNSQGHELIPKVDR
jgi:hypothetical protein